MPSGQTLEVTLRFDHVDPIVFPADTISTGFNVVIEQLVF